MSAVGVIGILLGLLAWPMAVIERTRLRTAVFVAAYVIHVGAAIVFYLYSLSNVSDSTTYYNDPYGNYGLGSFTGTSLIIWMVQTSRFLFGGTFLDYFLVFQAFGFFGIAYLMRIFEEIYSELQIDQSPLAYLLLFTPGIHFWTSSIGKDGIVFTGVCMSLWAAMQLRRRLFWAVAGVLIVLAVRPHIALVMSSAFAATLFFDRASRWYVRLCLIVVAAGGAFVAAATFEDTFSFDVTDSASVSDFLTTQAEVVRVSGDDTAAGSNLLVRFLSLMFRPMFLDAEGAFGIVASFENLVMLLIVVVLLLSFRTVLSATRGASFVGYSLMLALGVALALSIVYYNVGLGLRQRTMFTPAIFVVFVAAIALRRVARSRSLGMSRLSAESRTLPLAR